MPSFYWIYELILFSRFYRLFGPMNIFAKSEFYKFTYFTLFQPFQHISYLYIYISIECFLIRPKIISTMEKYYHHPFICKRDGNDDGKWKKEMSMLKQRIIIIFMYALAAQTVEKNHEAWVHNFQNDIINALRFTCWKLFHA